jgi:cell division protein ZipA
MQANWSLVLNVVFLGVILYMIYWKLHPRLKKPAQNDDYSNLEPSASAGSFEDIENLEVFQHITPNLEMQEHADTDDTVHSPEIGFDLPSDEPVRPRKNLMLFLSAKGQNIFAGYELLQTLLSCGLRFGDGGLFHRHQHSSGQGPVLFSVAAASATGTFDLQNMGSMSMKGLCLFMELSGNVAIDQERLDIFIQTAKQLAEELHANLLDEHQKPVSEATFSQFDRVVSMGEALPV